MTLIPASRAARLLLLALACAALLVGGLVWYAGRDSHAAVVASSAPAGWKTIEYQGVRVDIPASWEATDTDDCEFKFEHWAPPKSPDCGLDGGVAFYASATFDPAHGPGVTRTLGNRGPTWGGYAYVGDLAVYASDDDRALVQQVVSSARLTSTHDSADRAPRKADRAGGRNWGRWAKYCPPGSSFPGRPGKPAQRHPCVTSVRLRQGRAS